MGLIYGCIVCLGDSLTTGARDEYRRCYAFELSDMLEVRFGQKWVVVPEGVNGETSADVLRRAYPTLKRYPEAFEVFVLCGTNDSKDSVATPPEIYRMNILGIIRVADILGKDVILGLIPDLKGFGAPDYTKNSMSRIKEYNRVLREIAEERGLSLVDLTGMGEECYRDGVHFSHVGNVEVAKRIMKELCNRRLFE